MHPDYCSHWPTWINELTALGTDTESVATSVRIGRGTKRPGDLLALNLDVNAVQCRAYGDREGTIPVGDLFNVT